VINVQDLGFDLLPRRDDLADVLDDAPGQLGHGDEALDVAGQLDEDTERRNAGDGAGAAVASAKESRGPSCMRLKVLGCTVAGPAWARGRERQ
jgi:hypothetical protein